MTPAAAHGRSRAHHRDRFEHSDGPGSRTEPGLEHQPRPDQQIRRARLRKQLIKALPVANGGGVPISNNETGFTPGASAISLRGLGPQATLVLIDGRRVAPYPIGNGGTSSFFDLRSIPEAAIESIEILKDGASTTYGADAVAGVVNIKLRHDYKGAEATIEYGNTLDKDRGEFRANVVFGVGDGNTNVTGVMNYYHRNSIFNKDRGYSAVPPFLSRTRRRRICSWPSISCRQRGTPPSRALARCDEPQMAYRGLPSHYSSVMRPSVRMA